MGERVSAKGGVLGVGFFYDWLLAGALCMDALLNGPLRSLKENNFQIHFSLGLKIASMQPSQP